MPNFFKRKNLLLLSKYKNHNIVIHLRNKSVFNFYLEDATSISEVGSIYKARIEKHQKGLNASFVDMGNEQSAFLYISEQKKDVYPKRDVSWFSNFKKGKELMVQVTKDPLKGKSKRVTHKISLPGLYLVYLPNSFFQIHISRRIIKEEERKKLFRVVKSWGLKEEGIIVRTKAQIASPQSLEKDFQCLRNQWNNIQNQYLQTHNPGLIWSDISFATQLVRDFLKTEAEQVIVDDFQMFESLKSWIEEYMPEELKNISFYQDSHQSLFSKYKLNELISSLLSKKVHLKSGGVLLFEETQTAVLVDVNTGRVTGSSPEKMFFKINMEAVKEIAKQIRLRNCGGIILIDFIDMETLSFRNKVVEQLKKELESDRVPTEVFPMSELGIVQMTRKRTRPSLLDSLSVICPKCLQKTAFKEGFSLITRLTK